MKNRQWFRFDNKTGNSKVAEIYILDVISSWDGDFIARNFGYDMGVTARAFVDQLSALPDEVKALHIHINSPGGDVQAGINIANALREQMSKGRVVETFVDGIAASIASVIAMAGSKVHIADNALLMIHEPWTIGVGNAGEMRKLAEILDTMSGQIITTYQWHSELAYEAIAGLMAEETWMTADEAIANGFATDKLEGLKAAASISPLGMAKLTIPDKFKDRVQAFVKQDAPPPPAPVAAAAVEVLRLCREGGVIDLAEGLIAAQATVETVTAEVAKAKALKAAAEARATEITACCTLAKLPELAAGYIKGGMPVAEVKAHLVTMTARLSASEIDGGLSPDHRTSRSRINTKDIYARMNGRIQ